MLFAPFPKLHRYKYQQELAALPKGTISEKKSGNKIYYYLKYCDGKKIVSRYIGKDDIDTLREQVAKRQHIEIMIKSLQEEKMIADKALEGVI